MRTATEVEDYKLEAQQKVFSCRKCSGVDPECSCSKRFRERSAAYEAGVPQSFWNTKPEDVTHNTSVFESVIQKYVGKLRQARRRGYGLLLLGDNGVGKTMFISYVMMCAIRVGWTAYYTPMPELDRDIKRGFKSHELEERLQWLLTSDFLAIDEMGKERSKQDPSWMDSQVERILKMRFDDNMPTLLATNMEIDEMMIAYGPTVGSIISGHYMPVHMEPGDFRKKMHSKMQKDMGY